MPFYLDTEDFFCPAFSGVPYHYVTKNFEFHIEPYVKGKAKVKPKTKRLRYNDHAGIAAIVLSLSMIGAVTAYTVYTALEVLFG